MLVLSLQRAAAPIHARPLSAIKPAQARREAGAALEKVREGRDPGEEKRTRRDQRTPETETFGGSPATILNCTTSGTAESPPSWKQSAISNAMRAALGEAADRQHQPARRHSTCRRDRAARRRSAGQPHVDAAARIISWAVAKDRVAVSPATGIRLPTQEQARDRVLSDDEIRWLWQGCQEIGWPFGPLREIAAADGAASQ